MGQYVQSWLEYNRTTAVKTFDYQLSQKKLYDFQTLFVDFYTGMLHVIFFSRTNAVVYTASKVTNNIPFKADLTIGNKKNSRRTRLGK